MSFNSNYLACECFMFYDDLYFNVNTILIISNYEFYGNCCLFEISALVLRKKNLCHNLFHF